MAGKRSGLGRGLDALFVDNATQDSERMTLRISEVEPNRDQPRRAFDETALNELADSIREHGVMQPILVRPLTAGGYQIVAGERRWRAAKLAGLTEIPAVVKELTELAAMELALVENLQREDLNAVEEALGYRKLMDSFSLTQEQVAAKVGKSRPAVANALRLLQLSEKVLQLLRDGKLSAGHARALAALSDPAVCTPLAEKVAAEGLSVRETERLVKKALKQPQQKEKEAPVRDSFYDEVALSLREALGRRISVSPKGDGGMLSIEFLNKEELQELANKLGDMK